MGDGLGAISDFSSCQRPLIKIPIQPWTLFTMQMNDWTPGKNWDSYLNDLVVEAKLTTKQTENFLLIFSRDNLEKRQKSKNITEYRESVFKEQHPTNELLVKQDMQNHIKNFGKALKQFKDYWEVEQATFEADDVLDMLREGYGAWEETINANINLEKSQPLALAPETSNQASGAEPDVIDASFEEVEAPDPEAESETEEASPASSGYSTSQTLNGDNHGIMIGHIQGAVNFQSPSHE